MMDNKHKKTILIDLDGVLNIYNGNYNPDIIPPVKEGANEFIKELAQHYQIVLFTTRKNSLASEWLKKNKLDQYIIRITNIKEPCFLYIDDRCINFNGNYSDLMNKIKNFQVWWKSTEI